MPTFGLERPRATVAGLLALAAVAIVATAWGFELIGGFIPCKLCLEQREPYYLGAVVAAVAFASERFGGPALVARLAFLVLAGLFAWGLSVAIYQAGAEWAFWPGPTDCGAVRGVSVPMNASDLLGSLEKTHIVDCTKAQIRILGLSFAGWNVPTSLGLIAVSLIGFALPRRTAA
ncbi:disulfide bond formation protein B [Siculibacillus lacustris]|uniref:Disulfide bond formation protein B n=1 Tax=Siculibacillus lacustris TaxID=1549641 RepID=A0A4Q9VLC1_9HYPH|nr:disulfide bond formation protein B [Siculibacillus lacustris]TBW36257.1 disulfide bond formation protein B [Siculibacillus lacustris]